MTKQQALKACAEWLVYCLKIGWSKSALDGLEKTWWNYYDEHGARRTDLCQTMCALSAVRD